MKNYLGIDLGTSSVKAILYSHSVNKISVKSAYEDNSVNAFIQAVKKAVQQIKEQIGETPINAIAISSQVGTYVVNGKDIISWQSPCGKDELEWLKTKVSKERFIKEIGMPHPDLISYPLPRLLYIKKAYGNGVEVLMPKEIIIRAFTGETVTDVFSMRGLVNPLTKQYPTDLLNELGLNFKLPQVKNPLALAGYITEQAEKEFGLSKGTPVYLGCNDFFAGLLGMGVLENNTAFDLSGTSEHIGLISSNLQEKAFVSGRYFYDYCSYGGTKSSGASCDFALNNFDFSFYNSENLIDDIKRVLDNNPPIFLPYLNGERAPIFDDNARGVFFGINGKTSKTEMAYATLEGVVFSLYHIAKSMKMPTPELLVCGGGSAKNKLMQVLKSELFGCPVVNVQENDTSAIGAVIIAMVGQGEYQSIKQACESIVKYSKQTIANGILKEKLLKRFEIYCNLYKNLKDTFKDFNNIKEN